MKITQRDEYLVELNFSELLDLKHLIEDAIQATDVPVSVIQLGAKLHDLVKES